ncbi:holin family protein [Thalassobius sp. S69A]|uniref:holin family protein n=1 Tax=unclassified Thalassovita TaxID=2619711 RepID=UPI000C6C228B|nr:carboxylesterase [Paracoccaceae bacterium]
MGVMGRAFDVIFGDGRNVLRETAEVFRENAEAQAERAGAARQAALSQFGAEFLLPRRGLFDRVIDGLNRLPRPGLALGTLGLFIAAMVDPEWFAARMTGIALVPEPLWWLLGAIVSFYFGARHQAKGQAFQERLIRDLAMAKGMAPLMTEDAPPMMTVDENPALADWQAHSATSGR